ncbi:Methionine aminopeptidase 1D, mitochondrial [Oopsacas minuta]|uniref:Methionine aminopeptidase n=1 Tax=Oopsacas minuta TaxID=111878 RepID=A0AAV7K248_9METZ|nr:Methionine aminopeptidase 1D, mitochondrial [Oopsacas minuta]
MLIAVQTRICKQASQSVRALTVWGRHIPEHIETPYYAKSGVLKTKPPGIHLISRIEEINKLKEACKIAKNVLDFVETQLKIGISTGDIDDLVFNKIIEANAYPVPLNFHRFPKSVCTSVNEVLLHGIPCRSKVLNNGDIVNVDITVYHCGYYGDVSDTFMIGEGDEESKRLVLTVRRAVNAAISICKPGAKMNKIGSTIESIVTSEGFRICKHYCGHGLGRELHLWPNVMHHVNWDESEMEVGMCFTIEPAVMSGKEGITLLSDEWSVVSIDGKKSAQYERAVLITENGCQVLT